MSASTQSQSQSPSKSSSPFHLGDKNSKETEMVHKQARMESTDSHGSIRETLALVNDTILDHLVSRFSLVNDHQVRGKWRSILSFAVIAAPLSVFIVMMWFQLYRDCTGTTIAAAPFQTVEKYTVQKVLQQSSIYYCGSYFVVEDPTDGTKIVACQLNHPFADGSIHHQCRVFYEQFTNLADAGAIKKCFPPTYGSVIDLLPVYVAYAECTSITTALVNSLQYALYATIISIWIYLAARNYMKNGLRGLFDCNHWNRIIRNKNDWKTAANVV